jgi:hypothetical protein
LNPLFKASLGFQGKLYSLIKYKCKLSLKKSAQATPPCPSYTPKNEHLGQFSAFLFYGFIIFKIIDTLSSL